MNIILLTTLILFSLKIGWNLLTPYVLAIQMWRIRARVSKRISMVPAVECILLLLAVGLSFIERPTWLPGPGAMILLGIAVIVGSYLHLLVGGAIAGWLVTRRFRMKPPKDDLSDPPKTY